MVGKRREEEDGVDSVKAASSVLNRANGEKDDKDVAAVSASFAELLDVNSPGTSGGAA